MTRKYILPGNVQLSRGERTVVRVEQRSIALFNVDDVVYAIDDSCPHAGSSLAGGKLDGRTVQCPAHGLCFSLETGRIRHGGALGVQTYPVSVNDGNLVITLPDSDAACAAMGVPA